jgi:hypothetical protein
MNIFLNFQDGFFTVCVWKLQYVKYDIFGLQVGRLLTNMNVQFAFDDTLSVTNFLTFLLRKPAGQPLPPQRCEFGFKAMGIRVNYIQYIVFILRICIRQTKCKGSMRRRNTAFRTSIKGTVSRDF